MAAGSVGGALTMLILGGIAHRQLRMHAEVSALRRDLKDVTDRLVAPAATREPAAPPQAPSLPPAPQSAAPPPAPDPFPGDTSPLAARARNIINAARWRGLTVPPEAAMRIARSQRGPAQGEDTAPHG